MTGDQFYITLPSNSSMRFFPENRTCCYITQLPRSIELTGVWEVGLAEIHYPLTIAANEISWDKYPTVMTEIRPRVYEATKVKPRAEIQPKIPSCLMFVYCDLVEPRIVGDVYAPLLRVVQACGKEYSVYGQSEMRVLSPPHYLPLMLTSFRTIEINIRTHTGEPMPFEYGTLTTTLHFRRIQQ